MQHDTRFEGIQALRFIAALLVVFTHATFHVSTRFDSTVAIWNTGAQGVNIFFVISGFVMLLSARPLVGLPGAPWQFIRARIIRIVPLYWTLNLLKICQILLIPALAFANPTALNIVLSMLFIPSRNADGIIETFYGVGWTLNFEMFFYLLVAFAILIGQPIVRTVAPVLILMASLSLIRAEDWPAVTYLFHPIVLNFLWGMVIAELYVKGFRMPPLLAAAMLLGSAILIMLWPKAPFLELQFAALVAGVVFLEPWLKGKLPRILLFGGDASYSLYLVHPMVGVVVAIGAAKLGLVQPVLVFSLIVIACIIASAVVYRAYEAPITNALRRRYATARVTTRPA